MEFARTAGALAAALSLAAAGNVAFAQSPLKEIESPGAAKHHPAAFRTDVVEVALSPTKDLRRRDEIEFSIRMKKGDTLVYSLEGPAGQPLYHEFHGHTAEEVSFYKKAEGQTHHGSLTAPFDGVHGWYLVNRSDKPSTVKLRLAGFYELIPSGEEGNEYEIEANQPAKSR